MSDSANEFAGQLISDKLKAIYALWHELKGEAVGPKRGQITPARLRTTMPWTFIMEVAGSDFRFSFAGDRVVQFMGKAHAGIKLSALLGTPFYDGMSRFFAGAVATKGPMRAGPLRASLPGKEHLEIEVMVLPVSEDGEHISALLGAFETWQAGTYTSA
ncbi:MAG: PAS domain-containing protein [Alphaproteobacteria bacterium]|nr:PAS domain-containing protein [Alphaproteobacteria bacterium]MBL7099752.1 PAS domain-containing protein [Alphaproteobacteria bacterium]